MQLNQISRTQTFPTASIDRNKNRMAQEVESEYVVIEKRTVLTNAFADEVANSPLIQKNTEGDARTSMVSPLSSAFSAVNTQQYSSSPDSNKSFNRRVSALSKVYSASPPSWGLFRNIIGSRKQQEQLEPEEVTLITKRKERILSATENLAAMAWEVCKIGDIRLKKMLTLAGIPSGEISTSPPQTISSSDLSNEKRIAQEALGLYLKTLALLQKATTIAREWWEENTRGGERRITTKFSDMVQLVRDKFNEVLEKAEFTRKKAAGASSDTSAERILHEHALELCRMAASNELVGEDPAGSEQSYRTSILILKAVVEDGGISEKDGQLIESCKLHVTNFSSY